jgi:hypothetical protein
MGRLPVSANGIGLSFYHGWSCDGPGDPYERQLESAGGIYDIVPIPHLIGMAGCAKLICHASMSGEPVTVFVVPYHGGDTWVAIRTAIHNNAINTAKRAQEAKETDR